ncbi:MAG: hypothetical protein ACYDCI_00430 [Candidatus Limnocylindrales bacterium]
MPKTELALVDHLSAAQLAEQLDALRSLSVDELRRELARSLRMTAESLVRLALIVRSLEERGDNLSELKIGLMPYLRQIAYGQILPEVVVRYAERPALVRAISALPFPDQEHLSSGGKVELALRGPNGELDHRLVDPLYLDQRQIGLVFTRGRIRAIEEQIILLESSAARTVKIEPTETIDAIKIDRKRGGLVIGRRFVPAATVVHALARLASPSDGDGDGDGDGDDARVEKTTVALSRSERERLREAAHRGGTHITVLVRRTLRAAGLI